MMNPPSISPGSYEGFQYWTLSERDGQLRIETGRVPWRMIVLVELILGVMGGVMLYFARGHWQIAVPMAGILTLVLLGNVLLPWKTVRDQRRLGPILVYHADRQQLELPREGLSLAQRQLVEFRRMRERRPRRRFPSAPSPFPTTGFGAAELALIYRNPKERQVSLLRVADAALLDDVLKALERVNIVPIVRLDVESGQTEEAA